MIKKIKEQLNQNLDILIFDEIDSTNTYAKELGKNGSPNTLVIANSQSGGRGRLGRTFISKSNLGIYMSILLRLNISLQDVSKVTCVVGCSIARVLEKYINDKFYLKWVNDIYINNKKICGILTESSINNGQVDYIVIGVGLNLYSQVFPKDVNASSIEDETNVILEKDKIISEITNQVLIDIQKINDLNHIEYFKKRMYYKNHKVMLKLSDGLFDAFIEDINNDFELVASINNEKKYISSGEIIKILEK